MHLCVFGRPALLPEFERDRMIKNKRQVTLDTIRLSNPQRIAVGHLLAGQKNKYKKLLHEAHERLHVIGDMVSSVEIWINANGLIEFVSPSMLKMLGHPAKDFREKRISFDTICHREDREHLERDMRAVLEGTDLGDVEYRFLHKNGKIVWARVTWNPVRTRRDNVVGVRLSLTDITNYTLCREYSVLFQHLFYDLMVARTDHAVCVALADGEIRYWNAGAETLLGWSRDERLGTSLHSLLAEEFRERFLSTFPPTARDPVSLHVVLWRKDGTVQSARMTLRAALGPDGLATEVVCLIHPE